MSIDELLHRVDRYILNPIIVLLFAVALVVFLWGLIEFIANPASDDAREKGKKNIIWGVVGMVIMVSVYGIIQLILGTFNIPPPAGRNGFLPPFF